MLYFTNLTDYNDIETNISNANAWIKNKTSITNEIVKSKNRTELADVLLAVGWPLLVVSSWEGFGCYTRRLVSKSVMSEHLKIDFFSIFCVVTLLTNAVCIKY